MDPRDRGVLEDASMRAGQGSGPKLRVVATVIHSPSPCRSLALSP